jgi:hypothetical protein
MPRKIKNQKRAKHVQLIRDAKKSQGPDMGQ